MIKNISGVVAALLLWMAAFVLLGVISAQLWPDYGEHGRIWFAEGRFTFTPVMAVCNLIIWFIAAFAAGWLVQNITRRRGAVLVLAGIIGLTMALNHLVLEWSRFPWWYNLGVVIPSVPAVLLGAMLAGSRAQ
jgi:hypothetical protein